MKNILTTILVVLSLSSFGQNKVCTVTEQFSSMGNTSISKVIITDSSGKTTTQEITHFLKDVVAHDNQFSKILNELILQGYDLTNPNPLAHGDMISGESIFTRTWFLIKGN